MNTEKKLLENENQLPCLSDVSGSLLERAMLALDDYLNAGFKQSRKQAAENAKLIYKEYYGKDYVNRTER
jgi:GH35 family endo-1,4-beta-xylanase